MAKLERITLYEAIEEETGNPLIVYATSRRPNASGMISADAIDEFIKQIELIPEGANVIDVLVESNGGDGVVTWRLISALRTKAKKIRALIPHSAFSAATLFCLGVDEIIMGKYGCLGPTDPQITVMGKDGQRKDFAFEDVLAFISFSTKKLKLAGVQAKEIYNRFFDSIEPFSLGFASRSSELSITIGAKLLQFRSEKKKISQRQALKISEKLNKNFFNHGHPLNRYEAKEIGLNVSEPSVRLEDLMWNVHMDVETEFLNNTPFDIISNYLQNNPALPPGATLIPVGEYSFDLKFAVVESARLQREYYCKYLTTLARNNQTLAYVPINVVTEQNWR
jgi:hypothetical protein